jgi:hypothetical protein
MKRGKTRKNNRRRNMYGGQINGGQVAPPPYSVNALPSNILSKLQEFNQETVNLNNWANQYRTITEELNNINAMNSHLGIANNISNKADEVYTKAQAFWQSIYGSPWVPPTEPAPAPV